MSPWQVSRQILIEFFNQLGQVQAPDGDITIASCPLRRIPLPPIITTTASQKTSTKKGG